MGGYAISGRLSADVINGGTFTVAFPTGTNKGDFTGGTKNGLSIGGKDLVNYEQFVAVETTLFTITNRSGYTWAAGSDYVFFAHVIGKRDVRDYDGKNPVKRACSLDIVCVNLGAPLTADADGISASQSVAAGASFLLNGALLGTIYAGRMVFDVPRNVVGAWTTASVVTVTGKDEYGNVMIEACASGTTFTGKKAFKEITGIVSSASITLATMGSGDVLGLPMFLDKTPHVFKELQDGATATAGTLVAGDTAKATSTTGDVRGTYDPNAACDGAKSFQLWVGAADPAFYGTTQYDG